MVLMRESPRPPDPGLPEGPAPDRLGLEVTHVRGVILLEVKAVLQAGLSPAAWRGFLAELGPEARQLLEREVSEYEWIPLPAITEATARHPSGREKDLAILRGAIYADRMLTRNHRWMLKVMTPELLVRQCPRIFAFYHLGGELRAERVEPGRALLGLRADGPPWGWFSVLLPTWLRRSLELCGADRVEVSHEPPDPGIDPFLHHYWLSWG